jgi:uncharacterized protein (TIGR02145 family)
MKTTGTIEAGTGLWYAPNTGATNESGFSALPGGYRYYDGSFHGIGLSAYFWSSTVFDASSAWWQYLGYNYAGVGTGADSEDFGDRVRCVQD